MPEVSFGTKGAAEVISAQQAINKAAAEGAEAFEELGSAAADAGKAAIDQAKKGEDAQEKLTKTVKQTREEFKKNLEEQRRIGRLAEQITKRNETAQERYNRILKDTQAALKNNAISADMYGREVAELNQEMRNSEGRFKSFAQQQEASFGKQALSSLVKYGAGLATLGTAAKLVTNELRAQQDLVDKAQAAKTTVSESRNVLIRNLVGESDATVKGVLSEDADLAKRLNVSESVVNMARADALSATGGDRKASYEAVAIATQFLKDRPADIAGFTGTLTDLSKATGTTDAQVNLGYLATVGKLSRVVDPRAQGQNLAPAIINQLAYGSTSQEAAALTAALTSAAADSQGATSGTGSIALAEQLRSFFGGQGTTGQRIAALQSDPAKAQAFLADASFEKKVGGVIEQLLTDPNSEAARLFRANLSQIPDTAGLRARGGQAIAALGLNNLNAPVDLERSIDAATERSDITVTNGKLTSKSIAQLRALTTRATDSLTSTMMYGAASAGGVTPDEALTILSANRVHAENDIARSQRGLNGPLSRLMPGATANVQDRIGESKEVIKALDDMINILRQQVDEQQKTNAALEDAGLVGVAQ
jgi:hypothetical protein